MTIQCARVMESPVRQFIRAGPSRISTGWRFRPNGTRLAGPYPMNNRTYLVRKFRSQWRAILLIARGETHDIADFSRVLGCTRAYCPGASRSRPRSIRGAVAMLLVGVAAVAGVRAEGRAERGLLPATKLPAGLLPRQS